MIPIRDDTPRTTTPYITYFLVALNIIVFFYEVFVLDARSRAFFMYQFGVIPAAFTSRINPVGLVYTPYLSILSSMFLHASWLHLIANMWVLWIFGDNIEDYFGHFKYLLFYLISGVAASALHIFFNPGSPIPSVGASGAIAGVMGGYFLLYPSARVLTILPIFFFASFIWLPAWIVLGYWFVAQFLSGAATSIAYSRPTAGGIAFWAHVGGFLAGLLMVKLLPGRIPQYRRYYRKQL